MYPRPNLKAFQSWLSEKGIDEQDAAVPLLMEAWNKALCLACDLFGEEEGTAFDVEERLIASGLGRQQIISSTNVTIGDTYRLKPPMYGGA